MFQEACRLAHGFTRPIIISYRFHNGECFSSVGTFVVVNENGGFITAYHIIELLQSLSNRNAEYLKLIAQQRAINDNSSLKAHEKAKQLKQIKIPFDAISNFSVWWGADDVHINGTVHALLEVDLAAGNLANHQSLNINNYPKFSNPNTPLLQGASLCKLGYPFADIKPTYEASTRRFILPPGSTPPPYFPLEGIFTRIVEIGDNQSLAFPTLFIETSSPGLRGQSGGPTFDVNGNIWALQSRTIHLPLGFGEDIPGQPKQNQYLKNQYLHVGWGTHVATITGFLSSNNISYHLST